MKAPPGYDLSVERGDDRVSVRLCGRVEVGDADRLLRDLDRAAPAGPGVLALDLSGVDYFDSSGAAILVLLRRKLGEAGGALRVVRSRPEIDQLLGLIDPELALRKPPRTAAPGLGARIWGSSAEVAGGAQHVIVFTGEVVLGLIDAVLRPHRIRWRETLVEIQRAGADSLPIVALISFLVGVITALQASIQLARFGADLYVANLVGLSMVRELGPLMTAIVAAGRSGAAYAAEIGTMKVSEEIDALVTLGLDRTRFLITPRVVALALMLPCLTIFSDMIGILGGVLVGEIWIDMPPTAYMRQTRLAVRPLDMTSGLIKAVVFGILVAYVGCLRGLQASGGAESVGRVTTSAVVLGLTLIIAGDALFTLIFNYWGI